MLVHWSFIIGVWYFWGIAACKHLFWVNSVDICSTSLLCKNTKTLIIHTVASPQRLRFMVHVFCLWSHEGFSAFNRLAAQFTPYSWTDFEWKPTLSLKRWLAMLGVITMVNIKSWHISHYMYTYTFTLINLLRTLNCIFRIFCCVRWLVGNNISIILQVDMFLVNLFLIF